METPRPLARRLAAIHPFHVMALLARAREMERAGRDIVHMEIGEPDLPTPAPVVAAGAAALARGDLHYTPALGLPALREAIAGHYQDRYGVAVAAERVVVTPGASGALLLALGLLIDPGSRVLLTDPGYPCNRHFVTFLGGEPIALPVGPSSRYQPTAEQVAAAWQPDTVAALLCSPANPTGTLVGSAELSAIIATVQRRGGRVVADEIYHGLVYTDPPSTALATSQGCFVVNSFSKYFHMTGWRLGWVVVPAGYEEAVNRLAQNLFLAASTPAQHAALACFTDETGALLGERRDAYHRRRDLLHAALVALGFRVPVMPDGAFYLYADCSPLADDSFRLAERLLVEAGVAVTPGLDFGDYQANRYLRFSFTTPEERIEEGVVRMRRFFG